MSTTDYLVILVFSLMILIAGLSFSRSGNNMKSFFAAGGNVPWWLSGLSLFMSFFSAGTFVVWGSIAYKYGWVAVTIQWMMSLGGFVIAFFIAPRWRKTGVLTVGQYIGDRYGPSLKNFYSYIFLVLSFVTTGAFLYPVAKLFNVSTGFSIEISVIVLGIIILLYTAAGGLWAVIITDVLQFVILFAAIIIVVPLAFGQAGGIENWVNRTPEGFFDLFNEEYSIGFLFAFTLYNAVYIGGNWAYVQRFTSVKDPRAAKKAGLLFAGLYIFSPILWMIPPMIYRTLHPDLSGLENEGAYLLMCKEVLPVGMLGMMLGGMIFATASSVNTTLNMAAAVFTNDIYKNLRKGITNRQLMQMARISTVVFGLITIGIALLVPAAGGIVEVVISFGAITGVPLYGPAIWALFSQRQTMFSIAATTLISIAVGLFFKFLSPAFWGFSLNRAEEMLVGTITPLVLLAGFEIYQRIKNQTGVPFVQPRLEEESQSEETSGEQNQFALRVMGITLILTGLMIGILGMVAESGKWIVVPVGAIVLVAGLLIYRK
ncbi:MAG: sodium:solute symporter family protein [Bacteroidia bacterium]